MIDNNEGMKGTVVIQLLALVAMILSPAQFLQTGIDKGTLFCSRERGNGVLHLEKGDHGEIVNGEYPSNYSTGEKSGLWCQVHIKACSTCRIQLYFEELSFDLCVRKHNKKFKPDRNWCHKGCDHIHVHEVDPPYTEVTHRNYFWDDEGRSYTSISANLKIRHCVGFTEIEDGRRFKMEYKVVDKTEVFQGVVSPYDQGGVLTSPNFPNGYSLNGETFTFMIQNLDPYGHIRLLFDDWDIAPQSQVKVYDGVQDNAPYIVLSHNTRPVMVSKSNTLVIIMTTGMDIYDCCHYRGFKLRYQYVSETTWLNRPESGCSKTFPMEGGALISFTGESLRIPKFYDCVWRVKRTNEVDTADGVVLRLQEVLLGDGWLQFGRNNSLEIRDGITSEAPLLARYTSKNLNDISTKFYSSKGLYIRLRGGYYSTDKLSFVYTAIRNISQDGHGCRDYFDFRCNTQICIDQNLVCDGLDHCGDKSDESPNLDCSASSVWRHTFNWNHMPYLSESGTENSSPRPICRGIWCSHKCVSFDQICDGVVDCEGREDEDSCVNRFTTRRPSYTPSSGSRTLPVLSFIITQSSFTFIVLLMLLRPLPVIDR